MLQKFRNNPKESFHVQYDRVRISFRAGAMVGLALSGMLFMLFSNWLPESLLVPVITGSAVLFGLLFYIFWPIVTAPGHPEDHPDNISPAERVRQHDENL